MLHWGSRSEALTEVFQNPCSLHRFGLIDAETLQQVQCIASSKWLFAQPLKQVVNVILVFNTALESISDF